MVNGIKLIIEEIFLPSAKTVNLFRVEAFAEVNLLTVWQFCQKRSSPLFIRAGRDLPVIADSHQSNSV